MRGLRGSNLESKVKQNLTVPDLGCWRNDLRGLESRLTTINETLTAKASPSPMYEIVGSGLFLASGLLILWLAHSNPRNIMRGPRQRLAFAAVGLAAVFFAGALAW